MADDIGDEFFYIVPEDEYVQYQLLAARVREWNQQQSLRLGGAHARLTAIRGDRTS